MIEKGNTGIPESIKSFQDLPAEYVSNVTANFVRETLDLFHGINFLNLSKDDCKNICSRFRKSGRNKTLEEYLKKMGVRISVHPHAPDFMSYVLEFDDLIFMEATNETFSKDPFTSNNSNRYLRPFTVGGETDIILQVEDGRYYLLEFYLIEILKGGIILEYGVLKNNVGLVDVIDVKRKHIHEVSGIDPKFANNILRIKVSNDPEIYIEFDGTELSAPVEIKESYPMIGPSEQSVSKSPTFH